MSSIRGDVDARRRVVLNARLNNPGWHAAEALPARVLVDTGAQTSAISEALVRRLGLEARQSQLIRGVHGLMPVNTYAVTLELPELEFIDPELEVIGIPPMKDLDGLLGMDVILQGTLKIYSDEQFEFLM